MLERHPEFCIRRTVVSHLSSAPLIIFGDAPPSKPETSRKSDKGRTLFDKIGQED
jgi:hypothetical protein